MLLLILFIVVIGALFLYTMKKMRACKTIPGPTPLPLIGNVLELGRNPEDHLINLQRLVKKYGHVVRLLIGMKTVILLTDPTYIGQVIKACENYHKGDLYKLAKPLLGDGLPVLSGEKWAKHRRILNSAFSNKQLEKYTGIFDKLANKLVDQLKEYVHQESVDITSPIFKYSLNVICKTAMQIDITENKEYHRRTTKLAELILDRFMSITKKIDFLYRFTQDYQESKECTRIVDAFLKNVIKQRKEEYVLKTARQPSILEELFSTSGDDALTDEEILDEVKTFIFAGSDTVGITLSFAMYVLAKHPEIQDRIFEEVDHVLGLNSTSNISFEDLHKFKYTERVLKEVLRMYAPATLFMRTLPNDLYIGNHLVAAETMILVFISGIHNNEHFYPNPEKFDPDRFLPENCDDRPAYSYIPFGAGIRTCIGYKFAMLEAKLSLVKIVRNFELREQPGHKPVLQTVGTLQSKNGLPVRLRLRRS